MKLRNRSLVPSLAVLLLITLTPGLAQPTAAVAASNPVTLILGEVGAPSSSFTQTGLHSSFIDTTDTQMPYLYLYPLGIDGSVHPGIANPPTSVPGTNATQWIISLRSSNMKWSDGVPINSTDLAYSLGIFLPTGPYANLSTYDPWGAMRTSVSTITILNSTSIKLSMLKPDPLFPVLSFLYAIYPYHYFKQYTGNNVLRTTPVLSGPGDTAYVPENYTAASTSFSLVANPYSPSWNGTTPTIQKLNVQLFTSESSLVNSLASGSIDAAPISASDVGTLASVSSLKVDSTPPINQMMVFLGTQGYPWNTTTFRQAVMYLIPSQQIDSTLYNNSLPTGNPLWMLPQAVPTYWPGSNTPTYNYSKTAATNLLKDAGLSQNGNGQWVMKNGTTVSVTIESDNGDPNEIRAAQMIQSSMQSVGLQANVKATPTSSVAVDYKSANFQFLLWNNQVAPNPYRWMRNSANYPQWVNSTFTATLNQALSNPNSTQSLSELKQAELQFASAAVGTSIVLLPTYIAYNYQKFTNWEPGLRQASTYDAFQVPTYAENVLVALRPAGLTTSTNSPTSTGSLTSVISTATSQVTTSASSTTSVPPTSANYSLIAAIVVVIIIIAGVGVYLARRRRP